MPNKSYQKGYRLEKEVQEYFEGQGFIVLRNGGSKFPDLIAIRKDRIPHIIECKWNGYLRPSEKKEFRRLAFHARCLVAYKELGGVISFKEVYLSQNGIVLSRVEL